MEKIIQKIAVSNKIVCFTGAGISTESGIPDYRSPSGIWQRYQPVYYQDFISNHDARIRYWQMKKETYELYKTVKLNDGHKGIAEFQKQNKLLGLISQNVDGLHRLSGIPEDKLVELHGTDRKVSCLSCGKEYEAKPIFEEQIVGDFDPPTCNSCNGYLKPATISFGQSLRTEDLQRAQSLCEYADIFLSIGSSLVVQPACSFPAIAKDYGAYLIIINRDPTPLDGIADYIHNGEIGEFFRKLNLA